MLLFSVALRLSVWQLKPEILVCKMAAFMINAVAERRKQKKRQNRALKLVYVDKCYLYTVLWVF